MRSEVEDLTGRRVVAFMSASHQDPDLMVEIFVLESPGDGDGARPELSGALSGEPSG